jgi:hypothetical protein
MKPIYMCLTKHYVLIVFLLVRVVSLKNCLLRVVLRLRAAVFYRSCLARVVCLGVSLVAAQCFMRHLTVLTVYLIFQYVGKAYKQDILFQICKYLPVLHYLHYRFYRLSCNNHNNNSISSSSSSKIV